MQKPLLEITGLKKYYPIEAGITKEQVGVVKAVDDITISIAKNEVLGVVGESGCGKTTLGRTILRIIEPTEGTVKFNFDDKEIDFTSINKNKLREVRRYIQMIFQNPYTSLNPRMTVFDIVAEPMRLAKQFKEEEITERVRDLVNRVGLELKHLNRYPHAFSGGQRQRIGIARALASGPKFVVADEAVSALDVSIQAQILNLLQDLKEEYDLTYMFIAHNLSVVEHISDRVCVMYLGRIAELTETEELFYNPMHPYTETLISAIPVADPTVKNERIMLLGEVGNAADLPSGCCFQPRCRYAQEICSRKCPALKEAVPGHFVACHFAGELKLKGIGELKKKSDD
ncbi:MAG: ATP-binding cassette domain-containing protein [Lacrimispora celerecrescens]|nr:ATP-binding cassette domain-containing protein [Lacrimispora celerecrescens]